MSPDDPTRQKRDAVQAVIQLLQQKKNEYRKGWEEAQASPAFHYPMPGENPEMNAKADAILNSKLPGSVGLNSTAATASTPPPPAGATQVGYDKNGNVAGHVINGKWVPINPVPVGNTGGAGGSY